MLIKLFQVLSSSINFSFNFFVLCNMRLFGTSGVLVSSKLDIFKQKQSNCGLIWVVAVLVVLVVVVLAVVVVVMVVVIIITVLLLLFICCGYYGWCFGCCGCSSGCSTHHPLQRSDFRFFIYWGWNMLPDPLGEDGKEKFTEIDKQLLFALPLWRSGTRS